MTRSASMCSPAAAPARSSTRKRARRQQGFVAALCAAALLLGSCNSGNGVVTVASTKSNLRVVNLIPNANAPVNVTLNDNPLVAGVAFESLQPYQQIDAVTQANPSSTLEASVAGSVSSLITTTFVPLGETNYTYIMYGPVSQAAGQVVDDTVTDSGPGNFNTRIINAASGIGAIDVYLVPPGTDLSTVAPAVSNVVYGTATGFTTLPVGTLALRVTPAGTKNVIFDSLPRNYAERGQFEFVVYSRESSTLVNVMLLNLDSTGTGSIINNLLAQFKVVNASLVGSPLNVFVNGVLLLSNIPYTGASAYQKTTAAMPTLAVESTATPGAVLLSIEPSLTPGTDSSIVLEGPAGALTAAILGDNNLPPGPGNTRVRFVNASVNIPALDVFVDFSRQISGLPQNSGAYSLELPADAVAGTAYLFGFNVAGTAQTVLNLPAVTLLGGKTYTIYVTGPAAAITGAVTQDD
ncbi:MAG TPA: DUF4397 domain-containing protein [Casimicrobiaceae bacterium]|nr:DUF4397 domain-containing protein [Casimicrobiaceae bacterium]